MRMLQNIESGSLNSYAVVVDEDERLMLQKQMFLHDFHALQKETKAMKRKLQRARQRKLTLMAEVRFLRRRYEYLSRINPLKKTTSESLMSPPADKPCAILGFNQASLQREELGESRAECECRGMNSMNVKSKMQAAQEFEQAQKLRLSICTNIGSSSNRRLKRVTWKDPVA